MPDGLRFGLLGPPVLYGAGDADDTEPSGSAEGSGGGVRSVGSGKTRALFVALLLEPGRVVSVDTLKNVLWDAAPPPSAQASLHNHVTRLRRLLDDPERLRAIPPGYLLRVDEGELDVRVFETHARAARTAHAERDWARTVREATAALALWRGTPLGGLPVEEFRAQAFVQRLEEARLLLLERRYDAELHLHLHLAAGRSAHAGSELDGTAHGGVEAEPAGAHALGALAPELTALVAEHPLREAFHRLLMLVLHRTGRQAEALAVHRDLRARLLDELGVEPGPAVREAHVEILREPAAPAQEPAPEATSTDPPPRPAQLPPPPAHFTGRREALAELRRTLDTGPYEATRAPTPLGARGTA
ncbi:AfsR/SARP family transcriptional regulator, partial [Streptomyces caniscabiei]